jgi:regulator of replication initiation timing
MKVKSQLENGDRIALLKKQLAQTQAQLDHVLVENQKLVQENQSLQTPVSKRKKKKNRK